MNSLGLLGTPRKCREFLGTLNSVELLEMPKEFPGTLNSLGLLGTPRIIEESLGTLNSLELLGIPVNLWEL